jgi:DNA-binding MarR family transcriptional regulator
MVTSEMQFKNHAEAAGEGVAGEPALARHDFIDNYLPYLLARVSFLVSRDFNARLPKGIGVPNWRVLAVLSNGKSLTIGALARMVLVKQPTLTKVVDRLEIEGLVERRGGTVDRREVLVTITPAGRARVKPLVEDAARNQANFLEAFSGQEQAILFRVLRDVIDRIEPEA